MPIETRNPKSFQKNKKQRNLGETSSHQWRYDYLDVDGILPVAFRSRLHELFGQIEREFETLYSDNIALQEKIDMMTEKCGQGSGVSKEEGDTMDGSMQNWKETVKKSGSQISQRIKLTYKTSANRIVSQFKSPTYLMATSCSYIGHRDGVWEVNCSKVEPRIIATASADHTARLWNASNGVCVLQYTGHSGSVNCVRFHPTMDLVATSSGDQRVHIWRAQVQHNLLESQRSQSSGDEELELDKENGQLLIPTEDKQDNPNILSQPLLELLGHTGVVVAADWLNQGSNLVTASWDRTANVYDTMTGALITSLTGHDDELTNVCSQTNQKLVMTSSKDMTFRLWDLRDSNLKVNVFQGHTQTVTTAIFGQGDVLVSGSDDRMMKFWDLRNMRSPMTTVRTDSPINRLSIAPTLNLIATPQDNGHLRLYDLNGLRVGRIAKLTKVHSRMVCSTSWNDNKLYSCGFDRNVFAWNIMQQIEK